jgi:hypothetical protein
MGNELEKCGMAHKLLMTSNVVILRKQHDLLAGIKRGSEDILAVKSAVHSLAMSHGLS